MRIAVLGAGVSGLVAAHQLHERHDVAVFESEDYAGGHTRTVEVVEGDRVLPVDTGFIVFNERNYPSFTKLLARLGVASRPSSMSFSVRDEAADFEYRASSLDTLFAQRRNLLRPDLFRMVADVRRFYREAPRAVRAGNGDVPLGEYLEREGYSAVFVRRHLLPMAAAVWSSGPARVAEFPLRHLVEFFGNHGMLRFRDRPTWRVVEGGSHAYVKALVRPFADRIRLGNPARRVRRDERGVVVTSGAGEERFDAVVVACHSDQALGLLADPSEREREILGAIPYTDNDVVLHTDTALLPRRRRAWSSWNVHVEDDGGERVAMTYSMNILQGLDAREQYCVTLNRTDRIDPARVLKRFTWHHPLFTAEAIRARERRDEISGVRRTAYAGAYWGYGFHEDGVVSGIAAAARVEAFA